MPFCEADVYWEGSQPDWLATATMAVFLWPLARALRLRQAGLAVLCLNLIVSSTLYHALGNGLVRPAVAGVLGRWDADACLLLAGWVAAYGCAAAAARAPRWAPLAEALWVAAAVWALGAYHLLGGSFFVRWSGAGTAVLLGGLGRALGGARWRVAGAAALLGLALAAKVVPDLYACGPETGWLHAAWHALVALALGVFVGPPASAAQLAKPASAAGRGRAPQSERGPLLARTLEGV